MAGKRGIFDGITFIVGPLQKENEDFVRLIELADGKVVEHSPHEPSQDMRYISLVPAAGHTRECMSASWVYDCVGAGKLLRKETYTV